jgi:hypothetical protein
VAKKRDQEKRKKPIEEFLNDEEFDLVTRLLPRVLITPLGIDFPPNSAERVHDDHEGTWTGCLQLTMSADGDMWIRTTAPKQIGQGYLRFRALTGGSASPRIHNALRMLALAIKLDNEAKPHSKKPS